MLISVTVQTTLQADNIPNSIAAWQFNCPIG